VATDYYAHRGVVYPEFIFTTCWSGPGKESGYGISISNKKFNSIFLSRDT